MANKFPGIKCYDSTGKSINIHKYHSIFFVEYLPEASQATQFRYYCTAVKEGWEMPGGKDRYYYYEEDENLDGKWFPCSEQEFRRRLWEANDSTIDEDYL